MIKKKKYLLLIISILGLLSISLTYYFIEPYYSYGGKFDTNYSAKDARENFIIRQSEIFDLVYYIDRIAPKNKKIIFSYDGNINQYWIGIESYKQDSLSPIIPMASWSNVRKGTNTMSEVCKELGWPSQYIDTLLFKLKDANCIGLMSKGNNSKNPIDISFRNGDIGHYSYIIYTDTISDELKKYYEKRSDYIIFNEFVVFNDKYPL